MSRKPEWVKEEQAAEMMGYRPRVLRRHVKSGRFNIAYTNPNNRNFQYDRKDIENELLKHSTFIK